MNTPRTFDDMDSKGSEGTELVGSDGRWLPLVSATLRAVAGGGLARVVLEQTFENPHEDVLRVTYKMPLPADGAVSGYEFTVGGRTIAGRVEPKAEARERFEQAIADGRTAALLEEQRADIFTQEIGNIPAGERVTARITVDQRLAWLPEGEWELRFPTVLGPRYVGAEDTEADARAVHVEVAKPGAIRARLHLEVEVRDELAPGRRLESPSHAITPSTTATCVLEALEGAKLDRDVVVRWAVGARDVGASLAVARPSRGQPHADLSYGLVTIVPPLPEAGFAAAPRDLIVLLDTSGSMGGSPLDQAKCVVSTLVESLGGEDTIELIEFSSSPRAWKRSAVQATAPNKKEAIRWVRALRAGGSTEMYSAIKEGLRAIRPGAQRQVVLVSDGYVGGEQKIVELLHERLPADCRMHVVGVGSAVNRSLAVSLSRAGRGAEILVGPDEDAERATKRLVDRMARAILTDVAIQGDAVIEVAPEHVPDVYAGAPVVCGVKLAAAGGKLVVTGKLAGGGTWRRELRVPALEAGEGDPAVVALFGREHVADLEMRWTIGRETEVIDRNIERVGVVFQIATRMTSWVAVDTVRSVDPRSGSRLLVQTQPQELPYGTSLESFGLASAGAHAPSGALLHAASAYGGAAPRQQAMGRVRAAPPAGLPPMKPSAAMITGPLATKKARRSWIWVMLVVIFALLAIAALLLRHWR
jgi:Ca-activated chloride channel family protein